MDGALNRWERQSDRKRDKIGWTDGERDRETGETEKDEIGEIDRRDKTDGEKDRERKRERSDRQEIES